MADVAVNTLPTEASPVSADTVLTVKDADGSLVRVALSDIKILFAIPSSASDVGAIPAPASPTDGQFLMYDSNAGAWVAASLPVYNGGVS